MRQLLYVSKSTSAASATPIDAILLQSRTNNALDGVTGLLWTDGDRFAQVVEGADDAIADLMRRLRADPRHRDIEILQDRTVEAREFGSWSMEMRAPDHLSDLHDKRMRRALDEASDAIRNVFASLIPPTDG